MFPGQRTADGALYITTIAPQPDSTFQNGLAVSAAGALHVTEGAAPQQFHSGFGVMNLGALCILLGGTVATYNEGIPMTADGRVVAQLNQPVSPGDAYVGGVRVGPLGGVYVVDTSPPLNSPWSNGFSSGFGNGP